MKISRRLRPTITRAAPFVLALTCLWGYLGSDALGATPLSKAQYRKQVTLIGKTFGTDVGLVSAATSVPAAALALTRLRNQLAVIDKQLNGITPPTAIKADNTRLVNAIREFENELGPVIAKLKSGAIKTLSSIPSSFKGQGDIASAVAAINKAGYNIG